MGWCCEDGTHEGYLVGMVRDETHGNFNGHVPYRLRELGGRDDETHERLHHVRVACACGWRSPLLYAPPGTGWFPSCVHAPEHFEDAARELWERHTEETGRVHDGGACVYTLARHGRKPK